MTDDDSGTQSLYGRLDPEQVGAFGLKVWQYKQGELVSLMIHLGDRLGIYRTLQGRGPVTVAELAEASGLKERWLLEWLRGQTAAGLIEYHGAENGGEPRFELSDVGAAVLADEEGSVAFAGGAFGYPPSHDVIDGLAEAFQTGVGLSYQRLGPCAAHRTERMLGPWTRQALVPRIIPALDGVEERLRAGIDVVDVGCGGGVALLSLARAFPASRFTGIDPSEYAIEIARERTVEAGVENAEWRVARSTGSPFRPACRPPCPSPTASGSEPWASTRWSPSGWCGKAVSPASRCTTSTTPRTSTTKSVPDPAVLRSVPAQVDPVDRDAIRRQGFAVPVGDFEDERSA